jgi:hypothetical protein
MHNAIDYQLEDWPVTSVFYAGIIFTIIILCSHCTPIEAQLLHLRGRSIYFILCKLNFVQRPKKKNERKYTYHNAVQISKVVGCCVSPLMIHVVEIAAVGIFEHSRPS